MADISERKNLEEELAQAQKMESIGRLAGGVAHDFNNLLTLISGYTEMALDTLEEGDSLYEELSQVNKAAERAATLTRQLLAFSCRQLLRPEILDLNKVVADCTRTLQRLIGEAIAFIVKPGESLWGVKADLGQFEHMMMNLAVNARDAMPKGGTIVVETSNYALDDRAVASHFGLAPGSYVRLAMSDTGIGMDSATQAKIFEPFFMTKGIGRGTGMGLPSVHGIVKQSGGSIFVFSEPGRGTTFEIYLPREAAEEAVPADGVVKTAILRGTETILLVEDEEAWRMLAERALKQAGYTVLSASNGADALALVEQQANTIHLVLTDVVMPVTGGRELADRIIEMHPDYKILYMSGYTGKATAVHGVLDKGTQLLSKPFTVGQLTQKVREVLDV